MSAIGTFRTLRTICVAGTSGARRFAQAADKAGRTRDVLARHGTGTGSFEFETTSGVYTELQCGS